MAPHHNIDFCDPEITSKCSKGFHSRLDSYDHRPQIKKFYIKGHDKFHHQELNDI
jgi:hypothetical protein